MVLVHYGEPSATRRCLQALARQERFPHQVIVVDHDPGQGLPRALDDIHPALRITTSHGNPGFGVGCNLGADAAFERGTEGVWFLNNDAVTEYPLPEELSTLARRHPEAAFWGHTQCDGGRLFGADRHSAWYGVPCSSPANSGSAWVHDHRNSSSTARMRPTAIWPTA